MRFSFEDQLVKQDLYISKPALSQRIYLSKSGHVFQLQDFSDGHFLLLLFALESQTLESSCKSLGIQLIQTEKL